MESGFTVEWAWSTAGKTGNSVSAARRGEARTPAARPAANATMSPAANRSALNARAGSRNESEIPTAIAVRANSPAPR